MSIMAEKAVELPIPDEGTAVRMVDQEIVPEQFYMQTAAEGTPEQKGRFRRQRSWGLGSNCGPLDTGCCRDCPGRLADGRELRKFRHCQSSRPL
jgi:hypothetical protein